MDQIKTLLANAAVKALVADFLMTFAATLGLLNVAPTSIRETVDLASVFAFAIAKSAGQALFRAALKWANA